MAGAGGRGSVDRSACGWRRDEVAATPGRWRSDGGTTAPPGAVSGMGGRLRDRPLSLISRSPKLVTGAATPCVARGSGVVGRMTGS